MRFKEFEEIYLAPQCGFDGVEDYYKKCSSKGLIADITIPCDILFSRDDPIICSTSLDELILPENIKIFKTDKGGHMGYLGKKRFHWMDKVLIQWIKDSF